MNRKGAGPFPVLFSDYIIHIIANTYRKRAAPFPVHIYDYMYNYSVQQDGRPFPVTL